MFLFLLGGSLTLGAFLLAAASYTDGALVALRTAAEVIGWLFVAATVAGIAGLRNASIGRMCAAGVTLCAGLAALSMSYFLEWSELPRASVRHAAADTSPVRAVPVAYQVIEPVMRPAALPEVVNVSNRQRKAAAAPLRQVMLAASSCSTASGVESLQCDRCSDRLGLAWIACQESVRLQYCETEAGDERTCPSPIPASHPG
jgi:hypothetical protein